MDLHELVKQVETELDGHRKLAGSAPAVFKWVLWIGCKVFRLSAFDQMYSSVDKPLKIDNSKIKNELGIQFINPVKSLVDMAKKVEELRHAEKEMDERFRK